MGERTTDEVGNKTPEELRGDIEETRADMGETIDAIQDRISPSNMKETIREETIGRARAVADQAQENLKRGRTRFQQLQDENPALAYGLVAGIVVTVILLIWLAFRRD